MHEIVCSYRCKHPNSETLWNKGVDHHLPYDPLTTMSILNKG
jgi:hypothetical protein